MKLKYKILDNGTAVILTRQPDIVYDELQVDFLGAPIGATAIFESNGVSMYRLLYDGTCSIPSNRLDGVITVTLALLDGSASPRRWICEEIMAKREKNGGTLISPNDMDLPARYVELKLENEEIRKEIKLFGARIEKLNGRLETLLEGYDLT